jgi:protein-S-isoprenylcysteine O-methyltransferase Ste14
MPIMGTASEWGGHRVPRLAVDGLASAAAGTVTYWQLIVFAVVWGAGILLILFHLVTHPALFRRRLRVGPRAEPAPRDRIIALLLVLCVLALAAVTALESVSGWSQDPVVVVLLGDLLVAGGLVLVFLAFRANPFAASMVQVEPEQTVISTGPYALVRHPMYSGGLLLFLGAPVALGSWWGLVLFPPILVLFIWRLKNEETYLSTRLPGYRDYCAKVTYRLIPSIW